ncbi:MAG: YbaB/EbfC family nucleoid-associated protein [Planctomycetota bacterium]
MKGLDFGGLMKQAQKMQKDMERIRAELADRVVEGSAGGGKVTAQASGAQQLVALKIAPEVVDPADVGMLEDLVTVAVNQALKKSSDLAQTEMAKVTGGMGIPGM